MTLEWMARQLATHPGGLNLQIPRYNPRPAGVIRPGSATDRVLAIFQANPKQWLSHANLAWHTGLSHKPMSWALIYLQRQGLIEASTGDDERNSRYCRYRIVLK
jgi:hypothetical protein